METKLEAEDQLNGSSQFFDIIIWCTSLTKLSVYIAQLSYEKKIIGEAVKNIPLHIKDKHPDIEWKKISGLRDILAHEYFGIDLEILWDIIKNKLPDFKTEISRLS